MLPRYMNEDEREIAERLRREALAQTPEYSPLLHQRMMNYVRTVSARSAHSMDGGRPGLPRMRISAVSAAAALILLSLLVWSGWFGGRQSPVVVGPKAPPLPDVKIFEQTAADAYAQLQAKLAEGQLAYLDQDARRLANFVLDTTRVLPVK